MKRAFLSILMALVLVIGYVPAAWAADNASAASASSDAAASSSAESPDTDDNADKDKGDSADPDSDDNSGSDPKPDPKPDPDPDPKPDPGPEPEPERYYVDELLLQWDKPDAYDLRHFVGDNAIVEPDYKEITITEFGEKVQLNGWYLSTDGTGVAYQTADASTKIGSFDLKWKSSDETIATVDPSGLVTPKGKNGSVVITATVDDENVYQGKAPKATVTIVFDGQEGKYVERVEILNEEGDNIGETWGGVTVYTDTNTFHQLQARITWCNAVTGEQTVEVTGSGEDYDAKNVDTTITWNVSGNTGADEAPFYVNADTGRLKTGQYAGSAYITCTAVGGLGGKAVTDTANVQLDTGVYRYDPSDSLNLKVVWEERPDEVVKKATFTYDELLARLSSATINATVVNNTRYGVISAEGWLFKDVVGLVSVADADVLQYRFATSDGYDNPISYQYLFESGNRYYFPNYDIGSLAEGQIVPPLLAYKSALVWNSSEANPSIALDDGNRFRLVFGCLASGDANTSFQIYYITGITVVLKGGPSAGTDPGGGDDPQDPDNPGKPEDPEKKDDDKKNHTGGSGGGPMPGASGGSDGQGATPAANNTSATPAVEAADSSGSADGDLGSSKRWRVYQMMNKTNSDVPDWNDENPLSPFALPIAAGAFAVGAGATGLSFRRRLK